MREPGYIDWARDDTRTVVAAINARSDAGGVADRLFGEPVALFDAHAEDDPALRGPPGAVIGRRHGAVCRATVDGAVWIGQLGRRAGAARWLVLPATTVLSRHLAGVPFIPVALSGGPRQTYREIDYREDNGVVYLGFNFYLGAAGATQCRRLRDVFCYACERPVRAIVLLGGPQLWCSGLHLGLIEAAPDPAAATWDNVAAVDALIETILDAPGIPTVAVLRGAAAGAGAFLALAADRVLARRDCTVRLRGAGGLLESGYWEYLLTRRLDSARTRRLLDHDAALDAAAAAAAGLIDRLLDSDPPPLPHDLHGPVPGGRWRCPAADRRAVLDPLRAQIDDPGSPYHRARRRLFKPT